MSLDNLKVLTVDYPVGKGGGCEKVLVLGRWRNVFVFGKCKCVRVKGQLVRLKDLLHAKK